MTGTNPVGTWALTISSGSGVQLPTAYKSNIDADFAVAQRVADRFAPHPSSPAAMNVVVDAGTIDYINPTGQQFITEVTQQTVTIGAAPSSPNNRIDLVVVDAGTGVASAIAGTPAGSPSPPALPAGKRQICQVSVPNGTVAIAAANITDLRAVWGSFAVGIPFAIAAGSSDALTGTFTPATPTLGASYDGYIWRVRAIAENMTTTPTFAPDGQGPWTIKKQGGAALAAGDIPGANAELLLGYNYNSGSPFIEYINAQPQISYPVTSVFGRTGAVVATSGDYSVGEVTGAAPTASPAFTGTPAAPTPTTSDNSTKIATTAFVKNQGYITSAPTGYGSVGTYTGYGRLGSSYSAGSSYSLIGLSGTWECMSGEVGTLTACCATYPTYLFQRIA